MKRKVENEIGSVKATESFSGMMAGVRVKELIGDVGENGSASRRDAASGDTSQPKFFLYPLSKTAYSNAPEVIAPTSNAFVHVLVMRKLTLFLSFWVLLAVGISEIPEHIRLSDDVSNDFVLSSHGFESFQTSSISKAPNPAQARCYVEAVSSPTFQELRFQFSSELFHPSGQELLLFFSIHRI